MKKNAHANGMTVDSEGITARDETLEKKSGFEEGKSSPADSVSACTCGLFYSVYLSMVFYVQYWLLHLLLPLILFLLFLLLPLLLLQHKHRPVNLLKLP